MIRFEVVGSNPKIVVEVFQVLAQGEVEKVIPPLHGILNFRDERFQEIWKIELENSQLNYRKLTIEQSEEVLTSDLSISVGDFVKYDVARDEYIKVDVAELRKNPKLALSKDQSHQPRIIEISKNIVRRFA